MAKKFVTKASQNQQFPLGFCEQRKVTTTTEPAENTEFLEPLSVFSTGSVVVAKRLQIDQDLDFFRNLL